MRPESALLRLDLRLRVGEEAQVVMRRVLRRQEVAVHPRLEVGFVREKEILHTRLYLTSTLATLIPSPPLSS